MKKQYTTKKEIKDFKEKFSNGEIETEVISNLLNASAQSNPEYFNFWYPKEDNYFGLIGVLKLYIVRYGEKALEEKFGKYDFIFDGNRRYKNHILNYNDLTIIASEKREVVLQKSKGFKNNLVKFEEDYAQLTINYIFNHYDELQDFEKESLNKIQKAGIIDENNIINFKYYEEEKIKTNKLK